MPDISFVKLNPEARIPFELDHEGDACFPLYACLPNIEKMTLWPGEKFTIGTGLAANIPEGYFVEIRPRSGLASNNGITVLNTPGTIDYCYSTGEWKVILINLSNKKYEITHHMKIAQWRLVEDTAKETKVSEATELRQTTRGSDGFGSTGNF